MCIFSRSIGKVATTRIFARLEQGWQCLAYQMRFTADQELAMILPFPAALREERGIVGEPQFVNLEKYPYFFEDLERGFPAKKTRSMSFSFSSIPLEIHEVGAFEASFVPTIRDFHRLDPRFQLPARTLSVMRPLYSNFSFAVFKLKKGLEISPHPMAFKFKSANPDRVFFPTIHVHDGSYKKEGHFDHTLYLQVPKETTVELGWKKSRTPAGQFSDLTKVKALVKDDVVFRKSLKGNLANQDTIVVMQ